MRASQLDGVVVTLDKIARSAMSRVVAVWSGVLMTLANTDKLPR